MYTICFVVVVVVEVPFDEDNDDDKSVFLCYDPDFPQDPPARSTVAVAGLPKGALFEMECIALCDGPKM